LIAYFALGANRETWMLYVGAPVTALDVLVPLALTYFGAKSAAKTAELERNGVLAFAEITGLTEYLSARKLVVLIDPTTQEYRIDWERSALVNGLVPAQVTLDEDNRTYDPGGQAGPLMEILQILKVNHVAFDRMVDVRSDPVLRRQIQAVVRRAAELHASGARPAPVAAPSQSIGERLAELEGAAHRRCAHRPGIHRQTGPDHLRNLTAGAS
jgi:hypothetical protein